MKEIQIQNRTIGHHQPVFIVAEIGANHNGDVELAKKTLEAAAECGVDAVKFQTYTAEELLADKDRIITWGKEGKQVSERIADMFDRLSLPRSAYGELFEYAKQLGLIAFSTPFSVDGLQYLVNDLKAPCVKIAASDVNYIDLLIAAGRSQKPVMLSLGKCTLSEADQSIQILMDSGATDIVVMHCVAQYPSPMEEMNLKVIQSLKQLYPECVVGFSDHSLGITAALGAVALGAKVVEKHFTLDKNLDGPDHWFSMDVHDMKSLVTEIRNLEAAMGHPRKRILPVEVDERNKSVRSIVLKTDVKKGETITPDKIKLVRPGWGISPYDKEKIMGMKVTVDLKADTVLLWEHFK